MYGNVSAPNVTALRMRCATGVTPYLAGEYATPMVEMRLSDDGGKLWSDWDAVSLGEQGNYGDLVEWRALGGFGYPGALFEFRCTDPVGFRVSDVLINERFGGR